MIGRLFMLDQWIDLDPAQVRKQIEKKVAGYIRMREMDLARGPDRRTGLYAGNLTLAQLLRSYEDVIRRERLKYGCVRVKVLKVGHTSIYFLNYNASVDYPPEPRHGTGGFASLHEAKKWFFGGGR